MYINITEPPKPGRITNPAQLTQYLNKLYDWQYDTAKQLNRVLMHLDDKNIERLSYSRLTDLPETEEVAENATQ